MGVVSLEIGVAIAISSEEFIIFTVNIFKP